MSTLNVTNITGHVDGTTGLTITNSTGQVTMPNTLVLFQSLLLMECSKKRKHDYCKRNSNSSYMAN